MSEINIIFEEIQGNEVERNEKAEIGKGDFPAEGEAQ